MTEECGINETDRGGNTFSAFDAINKTWLGAKLTKSIIGRTKHSNVIFATQRQTIFAVILNSLEDYFCFLMGIASSDQ